MAKLYLIPTLLHDEADFGPISVQLALILPDIKAFMVEDLKAARRFLRRIDPQFPIDTTTFYALNEHSDINEAKHFFTDHASKDMGIISEAGCPCVADPGSEIVRVAHEQDVDVIPLIGPSSILLALMASGLNGQNFAFNGYLPRESSVRQQKIRQLEKRSYDENQTQIFMEAPYRNESVLDDLLKVCKSETRLTLAVDITSSKQIIKTKSIQAWKESRIDIGKKPTIFLVLSSKN